MYKKEEGLREKLGKDYKWCVACNANGSPSAMDVIIVYDLTRRGVGPTLKRAIAPAS